MQTIFDPAALEAHRSFLLHHAKRKDLQRVLIEAEAEHAHFWMLSGSGIVKLTIPAQTDAPFSFAISGPVFKDGILDRITTGLPAPVSISYDSPRAKLTWLSGDYKFTTLAGDWRTPIMATQNVIFQMPASTLSDALGDIEHGIDERGHIMAEYLWLSPAPTGGVSLLGGNGTVVSEAILGDVTTTLTEPIAIHATFMRSLMSLAAFNDGEVTLSIERQSDTRYFLQATCNGRTVRANQSAPAGLSITVFRRWFDKDVATNASIASMALADLCTRYVAAATRGDNNAPAFLEIDAAPRLALSSPLSDCDTPSITFVKPARIAINAYLVRRARQHVRGNVQFGVSEAPKYLVVSGATKYGSIKVIIVGMYDSAVKES